MRASAAGWSRALLLALSLSACAEVRDRATAPAPDFVRDVTPILRQRCASCHGGTTPSAGWRAGRFSDVIACIPAPPSDAGVTDAGAGDGGVSGVARLSLALARPDHAALLDARERLTLEAWIAAGAPASRGLMHDPGIGDPRAASFHGVLLRNARWAQMLDATRQDACGRCHQDTPVRPADVTGASGDAPACTTCHDRPGGVLACSTCHGQGGTPFPPRDPCYHPDNTHAGGAHVAHANLRSAGGPLACEHCHPMRNGDVARGDHGNGVVEVVLDPARAGATASYDRATGRCSTVCHTRGGARERPSWKADFGPFTCNDCHRNPPLRHPAGACDRCHAEPDAMGTRLRAGPLHLNGRVEVGDGTTLCGTCHGSGNDPWPDSGLHRAHRSPTGGADVTCETCHAVPATITAAGHLDDALRVEVTLTGRAHARGAVATWADGTCASVACHGAGLRNVTAVPVRWDDTSGAARRCGACHGSPPPLLHPQLGNCESVLCHGGVVTPTAEGPRIAPAGRALHINGLIDLWGSRP